MIFKKNPTEKSGLEKAIDDVLNSMSPLDAADPEYAKMVKQLTKLYALKEIDNNVEFKNRVSKETLLTVAGNLAGILIIVGYEQKHVITSKGLGFLSKLIR